MKRKPRRNKSIGSSSAPRTRSKARKPRSIPSPRSSRTPVAAAEALHPDPATLDNLFKRSSNGLAVTDPRGRLLFANPAAETILGGGNSHIQSVCSSLGRGPPAKHEPSRHPQLFPDNVREIVRPDGKHVWCQFHVSRNSSGISFVSIDDITRVAEDAHRLHSAFQAAADPILWVDAQTGVIVNCNPAASNMLTRTPSRIIGQPHTILFPPAEINNRSALWSRETNKITSSFHGGTILASSGRRIPVSISFSTITESDRTIIQLMLRDDSDRRYADQALRESEEQFRHLSEQSPNMIFINCEGRIVYANRQCEQIMGYSRSEFYSEYFNFMDLIAPESRAIAAVNFGRHMRGEEVPPLEYRLVTKDGSFLDSVIASRLIPHKGRRSILGIITDITDIRRAQRQIEESSAELEHKNIALSQILARIEEEKIEIARRVSSNAERTLLPALRQLRKTASPSQRQHIDFLERSVRELTSEFGSAPGAAFGLLTPRELDICNRIRAGMSNKNIAASLGVSLRTIETHRNNIRRKLDISNKKVNLATHLHVLG